MSKTDVVLFLKRNFKIEVELNEFGPLKWEEFAKSILRAKPSRLDNVLEIEVLHRADLHIPMMIQSICERGIKTVSLRTVYPLASKIAVDRAYMLYEYQEGDVTDQWTEFSTRPDEAEDFLVDVMKISFTHKNVTDCVWCEDAGPLLSLVAKGDSEPP